MVAIYHITDISNLPLVISRGELCCDRIRDEEGLSTTSIAHESIKEKRRRKVVTEGPGGVVSDYAPFYFAPRSPMLYSIWRGNVAGYEAGQERIVHLVSSTDAIAGANLRFVFTDGHAIVAMTRQFDDLDALDQIDWDVMAARYWHDTDQDPDRLRRRQAEWLVHETFPWSLVEKIGVIGDEQASEVAGLLSGASHQPEVLVRPDWYY